MLGVWSPSLYRLYAHGDLRATMVRDGKRKYLVIPAKEVERLKRELKRDGDG